MKKRPRIKYWDELFVIDSLTGVSLIKGPLSCSIRSDTDSLLFSTDSGGGHGEPTESDSGRVMLDWVDLLAEAEGVRTYYYEDA